MQYFGFDRPSFAFKTFGFGANFDPMTLFAGGKQGVWYDPSDKSTLFQDVAGTVPVTKDGDPVGLRLDKSQGLVLGDELTPSDTSVWVKSMGTTIVNGVIVFNTASAGELISFNLKTAPKVGALYKVVVDVQSTNGELLVGRHNDNSASTTPAIDKTGRSTSYVVFSSNSTYFSFRTASRGVVANITGVSIKELKGNHAIQTVSAARPTYKKDTTKSWLYHDKVDDKMLVVLPAMTATVVTATDDGVTINYPVAIPAGNYTLTNNSTLGRDYGRLIIDKELSASEQAQVTAYFNAKRGA